MTEKTIWATAIFLGIAIFYFLFPPKKRNWFYGYRTFKSMESEETFAKVNKKASFFLFIFSIFSISINMIVVLIWHLDYTVLCILTSLILCIISTQIYIRKKSI
jgi:uncharacterized membrane protein